MKFAPFEPIAKSLSVLFHPYVEVIIHDLETDQISAIFNPFSKRQVGDPSLLNPDDLSDDKLKASYEKLLFDGRPLKCISTLLKNEKAQAIGLMCINMDVSLLHEMQGKIEAFLGDVQSKPASLFSNDWQDKINQYVQQYLVDNQLNIKYLSKEDKKHIIYDLYKHDAFLAKGAAAYIANILEISRASVYKYLKEYKEYESIESN